MGFVDAASGLPLSFGNPLPSKKKLPGQTSTPPAKKPKTAGAPASSMQMPQAQGPGAFHTFPQRVALGALQGQQRPKAPFVPKAPFSTKALFVPKVPFAAKAPLFPQAVAGGATATACKGELRFESAASVNLTLQLNGTQFQGVTIGVELDAKSKDGTKINITGLTSQHKWQDLKNHFAACGAIAFCDLKAGGDAPVVGQVRFETLEEAHQALALNGSVIEGYSVELTPHQGSKDGTKLHIVNLPPGFEWQEVKDFFAQRGLRTSFVEVGSAGACSRAEVRYDSPLHAQAAVHQLNGSKLWGAQLSVHLDPTSKDGAKLLVTGIAPGIEWQELKDHFSVIGQVAFCEVSKPGAAKGGGKAMGNKALLGGTNAMMGGANAMMGGASMRGATMGGASGMLPNGMMVVNGMIYSPTGMFA